jgi:hypothetical protein
MLTHRIFVERFSFLLQVYFSSFMSHNRGVSRAAVKRDGASRNWETQIKHIPRVGISARVPENGRIRALMPNCRDLDRRQQDSDPGNFPACDMHGAVPSFSPRPFRRP